MSANAKSIVQFEIATKTFRWTVGIKRNAAKRNSSLYIYVPAFTVSGPAPYTWLKIESKKTYITLKAKYGVGESFCSFVVTKLQAAVANFESFADIISWLQSKAQWKTKIEGEWGENLGVLRAKRPVSCLTNDAPTNKPREAAGLSIALDGFQSTKTKTTPAIRIRLVETDIKKQTYSKIMLALPKEMFHAKSRSRYVTLNIIADTETAKAFQKFAFGYLETIVDNWTTKEVAKTWATDNVDSFVHGLKTMWELYKEQDIFYELKPSKVPAVEKWWPKSSRTVKGTGVWCTRKGKHKICFGPANIFSAWTYDEPKTGSAQEMYGVGPVRGEKPNRWFVPTDFSFKTGIIHYAFKVQHSPRAEKGARSPTHELCFDEHKGYHYLKPTREIEVGTEFTFDYGYDQHD